MRNNSNENRIKTRHRLSVCCLMLFALAGNALAQGSDGQFVIRNLDGHYLAHVKQGGIWVLQDAIEFSPNCLWYSGRNYNLSGTNHNYYFIDDTDTPRFLSAPLEPGGAISLSASLPETFLLGNTDAIYYFYDWDISTTTNDGGGVSRGHKWTDITTQDECETANSYSWGGDWGVNECWEVYWVTLDGSEWKLTDESKYTIYKPEDTNPNMNAGRFRTVTIVDHPRVETPGSGGLIALSVPTEMVWGGSAQGLSATISNYSYTFVQAYTEYTFEQTTHYYYAGSDHNTAPGTQNGGPTSVSTYLWELLGEGAPFLTLTNGTTATPTLTYLIQNTQGDKTATVKLTVTYDDGAKQTMTANVTVKTPCQSPAQAGLPVCTDGGATVTWYPTAESYKVYWKKPADSWSNENSASLGNVTSYSIVGLEANTLYNYKVCAICSSVEQDPVDIYDFTTKPESGLMVYGSVFGGGRMANVGGKTEVIIINTDSIKAVYGGNDIAGEVQNANGSTIVLGVAASSETTSYSYLYNGGAASTKVRVGDVYGGGNGFYAYNGTSFTGATTQTVTIGANVSVMAQSSTGDWNIPVWTNGATPQNLTIPTIVKTAIEMAANDHVKVDSIFGGAKNAFITNAVANANGTSITVKGGTAFAVYGGNNYGGNQTAGKHYIKVEGTKTNTATYPTGFGRNFGIGYLFGGGNKVAGLTTNIEITGGMCDTVFGGGNAADVNAANVTVNCSIASGTAPTFGNTYSNAISAYSSGITINDSYDWDGTGIYNVRTLFGGNNKADMSGLPTLILTSGSVGTVYGGGNAGKMLDSVPDTGSVIASDFGSPEVGGVAKGIAYSTHVIMNQANMLVDYLYGGCQMSDVQFSTWVEVQNGHVGTVYGGCNISGDVGSGWHIGYSNGMPGDQYQWVHGATYVKASGGTIYKNLYAGSNGYYHCNDGVYYIAGLIDIGHYIGKIIPTHNETHVMVSGGIVKGNVYAGGNMAPVGFIKETDQNYKYRDFVGFASVRMSGGTVNGDVYGGGNMASIYGSNEIQVSGGTIGGALYGGNDQCGLVAQITNRVLPAQYNTASDGITSLNGVHTYLSLTGTPNINTVFGGGNGDYDYTPANYCNPNDKPIQSNTFVDINIDDAGHINTVYGGGDGVTVTGSLKVFLNVDTPTYGSGHDHVGTIFGGNNKGDLNDLVPDIILLHGQVNTVYGGCNEGALGHHQNMTLGGTTYNDIGSLVYLRSSYDGDGSGPGASVTPTAKVSGNIYGGCRMNGVTYNSLVLVEAGDHTGVGIFGGSDISGNIGGTSRVVVTGGTVGDIYGGGNGNYDYSSAPYSGLDAPYCYNSRIDMVDGTATNLYAGGYAGLSGSTYAQMGGGTVSGSIFGGGNEAGTTTAAIITGSTGDGSSTVMVTGGTVGTGIYGGCNATGDIEGDATVSITGGTIGASGVGNGANIHGGGYGESTTVAGDVTVTYGDIDADQSLFPKLYGELYGGSAFGTVNTNCDNTTTVNILNGSIIGAVYGGGLGETGNDTKGQVNGEVHVNVGASGTTDPVGKATLIGTDVFGCNNTNGSPQCDVYVDVYQTAHIPTDVYTYFGEDRTYAIYRVFGGGNSANYAPASTQTTYVTIHGCTNTVEEVYGASNAAHATRVHTIVDGGRFNFIFGGGNGTVSTSNVTVSTYSRFNGGHVGYYFGGSNRLGTCENIDSGTESNPAVDCGEAISDYYFNGGNQADEMDLTLNLSCGDGARESLAIYGGCRLGSVYGFIEVNVHGGKFGNLFGGCMGSPGSPGSPGVQANVKKYPTVEEIKAHLTDDYYPTKLITLYNSIGETAYAENYAGKRGDIIINVYGGAIGNLYGGCDLNGNVEGKIIINVESEDNSCGLFVGNVYGASNYTNYTPSDPEGVSPEVKILKGTIGGTAPGIPGLTQVFEGNVFGGSNRGNVISNPKVIIGKKNNTDPVTINGSVYGGGNEGDVTGSPQVIIVPTE